MNLSDGQDGCLGCFSHLRRATLLSAAGATMNLQMEVFHEFSVSEPVGDVKLGSRLSHVAKLTKSDAQRMWRTCAIKHTLGLRGTCQTAMPYRGACVAEASTRRQQGTEIRRGRPHWN